MKQQFSLLPKIAALSIAAAFAAPAMAQTAGSNIVNLGWFHLAPQDSSETLRVNSPIQTTLPGSGAAVGNADTLGIAFTHFFTDNFALTTDVGIPPTFKLTGTGTLASAGELGKAKQWSPAIIAKWYFGDGNSKFRPFVGAGVSYVWYSDVELTSQFQGALASRFSNGATTAGKSTADLSSSLAPVLNVGATYNFDQNWSLGFSVAYIPLKTKADITTTLPTGTQFKSSTSLTLNPIVTFLSVGYKF
ncbi:MULTISPECIES: OmpW family outer membrane protein [unclassified Herbaspirillum]|jgi:outer membrane protein|uniref:OmpW/AlkL family protein n=1 Tax=unclassified Herbaspirillum TaxID=2624150 RepID=UPI000E2F1CF6|nr:MULTISPECIES: OmpW family outer membrane protein [unclassified Herbaspirillum]RFB70664.1 OmpW family protein [Herbaspirillum sp. 3R-3a1]TFI08816.1 OmpW family protein [Herbaspirillum sp. 3R11]TFI15231.1 OmpW family protein [Herbaspirillum sp. 3R-11]TFI21248.1 OmpW family protein [Herbaspirillum sp. 3C11]